MTPPDTRPDLAAIVAEMTDVLSMNRYRASSAQVLDDVLRWRNALASGSTQALAAAGWQPIVTAPKDGTNVLLWWPFWCKGRPTIGWFGYKGIQQWVAPEALEGDDDPPTHWMPLPDAPDNATQALAAAGELPASLVGELSAEDWDALIEWLRCSHD